MHRAIRLFRNAILFTALALTITSNAQARSDADDPENGQSWLQSVSAKRFGEGTLVRGVFRATDDFGVTRDREFRIEVTGSIERGDRQLVVHRYEPECLTLSKVAHMTPDSFCDRLTLTYRGRDLHLAFLSYDANKQYAFNLLADPRTPGMWIAQHEAGVVAPDLSLGITDGTSNTRYQVEMRGVRERYTQTGEFSADELRAAELNGVELSLVALGDVLRSFNAYEFMYSELPRENPAYEPTPYNAWAENPLDGGCIWIICFGNLGGGGGGGNSNNNQCGTGSSNPNPQMCPWDLTPAEWPLWRRPKLKRVSGIEVSYQFHLKNLGPYAVPTYLDLPLPNPLTFVSLTAIDDTQPLVSPQTSGGAPFYGNCEDTTTGVALGVYDPFSQTYSIGLAAGDSVAVGFRSIMCPQHTRRPPGRYRLYISIDPFGSYDWPGLYGNNEGASGYFEWVRLN